MPDSRNSELARLKRQLVRERAARKQAEAHLENKSRELYNNGAKLKKAISKLEGLAYSDPVTNLANRNILEREIESLCCESGRGSNFHALHLIDLNDYKFVSGALGQAAADILLRQVARRLEAVAGKSDIVARIGADEFAILQVECSADAANISEFARKVSDALSRPYVILGSSIYCSASLGAAFNSRSLGSGTDSLFADAEIALTESKNFNRGSFVIFDDRLKTKEAQRLASRQQICTALDGDQFEAWLQPQFCLLNGEVAGYEALARWKHPDRGIVSPGEFIPVVEHMGLATKFGVSILNSSLTLMDKMRRSKVPIGKIGINLSAAQLVHGDIVDTVNALLRQYGFSSSQIELEVTEGALLHDMDRAFAILQELRAMGISIALDDFGTGYSSLAYLQQLPIDRLKIDQAFIRDLGTKQQTREIVAAIIQMAKALNLEIVAEGIETHQQSVILKQMGADVGQGYFHSKPLSPGAVLSSLSSTAA